MISGVNSFLVHHLRSTQRRAYTPDGRRAELPMIDCPAPAAHPTGYDNLHARQHYRLPAGARRQAPNHAAEAVNDISWARRRVVSCQPEATT